MKKNLIYVLSVAALCCALCACQGKTAAEESAALTTNEASETQSEADTVSQEEQEVLDTESPETEADTLETDTEAENVNEFGVSDSQFELLLEKFQEKLGVQADLLMQQYVMSVSGLAETIANNDPIIGHDYLQMIAVSLMAESDVSDVLEYVDKEAGRGVTTITFASESALVYALVEWKDDNGITDEQFSDCFEVIWSDLDAFEDEYVRPAYDTLIAEMESQGK